MNESCHTYEWVTTYPHKWVITNIWMVHVTQMNEYVTHMNESWHTYKWVITHIWTSYTTHMNESKPLRYGDSRKKKRVSPAENIGIWHCAAILSSQVPKQCTNPDLSLLYILISRCGGNWHLHLCTIWVLVFRNPQSHGKIWFFLRTKHVFLRKSHGVVVLFLQVPKKCKDLDLSLLYKFIWGTHGKFARENYFLALGVSFPQTCTSASHMFAASRLRAHYYRPIGSFSQQQIR